MVLRGGGASGKGGAPFKPLLRGLILLILSRWAIWLRLPLRQRKNLRVKLLPQSRVSDRALPGDAFLRLEIQSEPIGTRRREGSRGQRLLEEMLELTVHHKDPTARLVVPFK